MDSKESVASQVRNLFGNIELPDQVLERAAEDPLFLHHLILVKDSHSLLGKLVREAMEKPSSTSTSIRQIGAKEIAHATQSILSALSNPALRTNARDLELRLDACYSCNNRVAAPDKGLYKMSKIFMGSNVCRLCGCHIETKARLHRERCPAPDIMKPGYNLWGQPLLNGKSA